MRTATALFAVTALYGSLAHAELPLPACSVVCQRELAPVDVRDGAVLREAETILPMALSSGPGEQALKAAIARFETQEQAVGQQIGALAKYQRTTETVFAMKDDIPIASILPTSTLATSLDQYFNDSIAALEQERQELASKALGPAFKQIRDQNKAAFDALKTKSSEEIYDAIWGKDGQGGGLIVATDLYNKLDAAGRADLANLKGDILADQLKAVAKGAKFTQQQVEALTSDYITFQRRVDVFAKQTTDRVNALSEGQAALVAVYQRLDVQVANNTYRLDALEGVMWKQLSPVDQVAALQSGAFSQVMTGMSEAERTTFRADLDKAATLQTIGDGANAAVAVAKDLADFGKLVGVDLDGPAKAVNQGMAVLSAGLAIYSGNPMAIMGALGGLGRAFGGSEDGTSAALGQLRMEIQTMRREMYQYHVAEMQALESISTQIDTRFAELSGLQNGALSQIAFNTLQLAEGLGTQLGSCHTLREKWRLADGQSFDDRAQRLNSNDTSTIVSCREGIKDRFYQYNPNGSPTTSTLFSLEALASKTDGTLPKTVLGVQRYRDEVLRPVVAYTFREHLTNVPLGGCAREHVTFAALLTPPSTDGALRARTTTIAAECAAGKPLVVSTSDRKPYPFSSTLATPFAVKTVLDYGRVVYDVAPIYEHLVKPGAPDPQVMTRAQLLKQSPASARDRAKMSAEQLGKVIDLVNLSIAQLNLIGGDLLLDRLVIDIEAGIAQPADLAKVNAASWDQCDAVNTSVEGRYFNALCVLTRDDALRFNFARHWVRTRLTSPRATYLSYAIGLGRDYNDVLQSAFKTPMPAVRCGATWCLRLPAPTISDKSSYPGLPEGAYDLKGELKIPLPDWSEVAVGQPAIASADMDHLLALRTALVQRVAELGASGELTPQQRKLTYAALLVAAKRDYPPKSPRPGVADR